MGRVLVLAFCFATLSYAQPKRVLYLTLSAGFRHDSIPESIAVLRSLDPARLDVTATEDVSYLNPEALRTFDAVFFFTSGELPLSDSQKAGLLEFVRSGKGFGGAHSATDTLYSWPEYAPLIGATFDGHPWVRRVRLDTEDPANPLLAGLERGIEIEEEIYQFRSFSRERLRVLLSLDTSTADLSASGINRADGDFASTWVQPYGQGRVFYTALGHFEATWRDPRFQTLLRNGLLWMTRQLDAPADPRSALQPRIASDAEGPAIGNAASMTPRALSPGVIFSIFGDKLTPGSSQGAADAVTHKLAGATVRVDGAIAPLLYASPGQINAIAPRDLRTGTVRVEVAAGGFTSAPAEVVARDRTPGIFAVTFGTSTATIWATGIGLAQPPPVEINGVLAAVLYSGPSLMWPGLYQINVRIPTEAAPPFQVKFRE